MTKLKSPVRYAPITDINPIDGPQVTCVDTAPRYNRKKRLVALILHIGKEHHLSIMEWAPQHQASLALAPYPLSDDMRIPFPTLQECKQYVETLFRN